MEKTEILISRMGKGEHFLSASEQIDVSDKAAL